ncbi:MAG TPA: histidinol dehydrogenase [Acidimicrobiia bacterium]|nr:histidinol dehydrogenase [Acidimicrobiia bacterium]
MLHRITPAELNGNRPASFGPTETRVAADIVESVRHGGESALRAHAEEFGDIAVGKPLTVNREDLRAAFEELDSDTRDLLTRVHRRVMIFARAQRQGLSDLTVSIEGGQAGHRWIPVNSVGAYAPGGRYPLPSTVLMTVTPARVAGVTSVWVASPRPTQLTLAASWVAGADGVLVVGGAQAIAALAFGTVTPTCDMIVGPGNKYVTAAKKYLYGEVGIDGLAGPSEILVIADENADPVLVAADLLAQAEHDVDAIPALITTSEEMASKVDQQLESQLADLPSADVVRAALANGACVIVENLTRAAGVSDTLAPEHLAIHASDPRAVAMQVRNYGSIFVGGGAAEAFADYGAGPNHVLPTGGGARFAGGLSILTYLKASTWLAIDSPDPLIEDTARLARLEGLEAHARAALARSRGST